MFLFCREAHAQGKILIIGGGIANFTNVAATFKVSQLLMLCNSSIQYPIVPEENGKIDPVGPFFLAFHATFFL